MEFLDEEARPKIMFQSGVSPSSISEPQTQSLNKPLIFLTLSISSVIFALTIFFVDSEPLQSILFWLALSILVGPFAPASITGGDIRVGRGSVLELSPSPDQEPEVKNVKLTPSGRRHNNKARRSEELGSVSASPASIRDINEPASNAAEKKSGAFEHSGSSREDQEWTEEDFELLKKQMLKHPVGVPRRWEIITEAFRGRHGVESVVKTAKSMSDRKLGDGYSFARFLKDRKPMDKRVEGGGNEEALGGATAAGELGWTATEDIALLNALKAFPKEVSMRWEKIAVAVPGKSKNACMKRVAELKKGFRSSKATNDA